MRTRHDLREDQNTMYSEIMARMALMLVSGMGSGKTGATATAILDLLITFEIRKALLIAPKFVALNTWPDEFAAWAHTRNISYAICVGTEAERIAALNQDADVLIINRDVLPWLAKHIGSVKNWVWDLLVIDESSMFKEGAKRTTRARVKAKIGETWGIYFEDTDHLLYVSDPLPKADIPAWKRDMSRMWALLGFDHIEMRKIGDVRGTKIRQGGNMTRFGVLSIARKMVKRVVELTGTPTPNGIEDIWGQVYLLDQGHRLGRSRTEFRKRWFIEDRYTYERQPKAGAEQEILSLVKDVVISIPPRKLVDDPVYVPVRVDLSPKVMDEYRRFEKTLFAEPYDVEAVTKGVLVNKLLQFSNGSMFRADGSIAHVHSEKHDALDELFERAAGDPMLVFYSYKFDLAAIRKRHPDAVVANECDDFISRWNSGKIKKLLAHPASIGHGTNLQFGGHLACWFGLPWSLELYLQANMRLPRPGQKNQVAIYQILARGTYDEVQLEALHEKNVNQDRIIEAVRLRRNQMQH